MKASPQAAARKAGLRYVFDEQMAGITRHGRPGHFLYRNPAGKVLKNKAILKRIRALAIPPAWTDVWIAPFENAHLAATGRDAKGRKQYRYHPDFAAIRDAAKYDHVIEFARGLPQLRRRLKRDLRRKGLPREKILATVVTLLEETLIRIGNEDYAKNNHSFGLTTLQNRHAKVKGERLTFLFQGKSGKKWNLSVRDRRVARVVRSCQELPGQHLFEYRGDDGAVHALSSTDVNAYLREITGRDVSAKDFRTWAGTVLAAMAFKRQTGAVTKRSVRAVVAEVAEKLGNTVAVCRKCYIHPRIISAYEAGDFGDVPPAKGCPGLTAEEGAVLNYLGKTRG
jgi:DNA topoisomerase-1